MTEHEREISGMTSSGAHGGGDEAASGPKPSREIHRFWLSHRRGPFLFHENSGPCQPTPADNVGYLSDVAVIIDQGFAPCPKCIVAEVKEEEDDYPNPEA